MAKIKLTKEEKWLETLAIKTAQAKADLLVQLSKYPNVQVACKKMDIGRSTYYKWRNDDKIFAECADEAIRQGIFVINDLAESKLISNIQEGENTAIIYWLKNNCDKYSEEPVHKYEFIQQKIVEGQLFDFEALSKIALDSLQKFADKLNKKDEENKPKI